jgi:hypothetical protein
MLLLEWVEEYGSYRFKVSYATGPTFRMPGSCCLVDLFAFLQQLVRLSFVTLDRCHVVYRAVLVVFVVPLHELLNPFA